MFTVYFDVSICLEDIFIYHNALRYDSIFQLNLNAA